MTIYATTKTTTTTIDVLPGNWQGTHNNLVYLAFQRFFSFIGFFCSKKEIFLDFAGEKIRKSLRTPSNPNRIPHSATKSPLTTKLKLTYAKEE